MKQRTRFKRRIARKLDAFRRNPLSFSLVPVGYYRRRPHMLSGNEIGRYESVRFIESDAIL